MINKPVDQWEEKDLQELIEQNLGESIFREYKEQISISSRGEKKEICKDVSAIANSNGGQIIFGIEETKEKDSGSIPIKLKPIKDFSLKESMQQILADGILPRVEFQMFSIKSDKSKDHEYVVIDIPQSVRGPHFVAIGKENRFYIRRDYEAKPMTQREIEQAYINYFNRDLKILDLYKEIKIDNPNEKHGLPESAFCSIYFIPQYPVENLFFRFTPSKLTDFFSNFISGYLQARINNYKYSYEGFTYIHKNQKKYIRHEVYYRNGCCMISFSIHNINFYDGHSYYISLDYFALTFEKILKYVSKLYKECGYFGNLNIITNLDCIDNYKLNLPNICTSTDVISGGRFENIKKTSIKKMLDDPKLEMHELLFHLMQSYSLNLAQINKFIEKF